MTPDFNLNPSPRKGKCWDWQEEGMRLEMKVARGGGFGQHCRFLREGRKRENAFSADSQRELTVWSFPS